MSVTFNHTIIAAKDRAESAAFYRDLIALRRAEPDLADPWLDHLRIDYDEDARWFVMHRGAFAIACNFGEAEVDVPVTGEAVLSWGEPQTATDTTRLGGHSVAVLRQVR